MLHMYGNVWQYVLTVDRCFFPPMIFSHAANNILQTDLCFYHQLRKVCWKTAFVQEVENVLKLHTIV